MSDLQEQTGANATPRALAASSATNASLPSRARALYVRAAARSGATREVTRLACAASLAVVLGVGCGLWLFARLASASSTRLQGARSLPAARTAESSAVTPTAVPEVGSVERAAAPSSPVEASPQTRVLGANRRAALAEGREAKRAAARVEDAESADESSSPSSARRSSTREAATRTKAVRAAGGANPCATYTSTGSLSLRGGGTAALVLGGQATVTTPNWADIAVFSEGRAGGAGRAWTKYAVRSVSGRAGSYALRVASPCGAQTIPVRVTP